MRKLESISFVEPFSPGNDGMFDFVWDFRSVLSENVSVKLKMVKH